MDSVAGVPDLVLKVPGSSANLGSGFDSLCVALNLYLNIKVWVKKKGLYCKSIDDIEINWNYNVINDVFDELKDPRKNLVTLSAVYVACRHKTPLPLFYLDVTSDIPLEKGLGSSGAAIVAGVCIANKLCNLALNESELHRYAIFIEGFPDNVTSSLFGGFTLSPKQLSDEKIHVSEALEFIKKMEKPPDLSFSTQSFTPISTTYIPILKFKGHKNLKFFTLIPSCKVLTSEARAILPENYSKHEVVESINNVSRLVACLNSDKPLSQLHPHMRSALKDLVHQPYRAALVPGLPKLLELDLSEHQNIIGLYISGSGPSIQVLTYDDVEIGLIKELIAHKWKEFSLQETGNGLSINVIDVGVDKDGVVIQHDI